MAKLTESENLTTGLNGTKVNYDDIGLEGDARTLGNIPLLKLVQAMSAEAKDRTKKDIQAGMFINSLTSEPLGEEVVVRMFRGWRSRIKFAPMGSGNAIECSCPTLNQDGERGTEYGLCAKCEFNNFVPGNTDTCRTQFTMIVAMDDNPDDLYRIILSKTSYSVAQRIERALRALSAKNGKKPLYYFKLKVTAKESNTRGNSYFVYDIEPLRPSKDEPLLAEELVPLFDEVYKDITDMRINQIEHHNRMIAETASEDAAAAEDTSTLADELCLGPVMTEEEVPF